MSSDRSPPPAYTPESIMEKRAFVTPSEQQLAHARAQENDVEALPKVDSEGTQLEATVAPAHGDAPVDMDAPQTAPSADELDTIWAAIQKSLHTSIRREQFETWFRRTALTELNDEIAKIAVHNGFTRDWLNRYYLEVLTKTVATVLGTQRRIVFEVDPERTAEVREATAETDRARQIERAPRTARENNDLLEGPSGKGLRGRKKSNQRGTLQPASRHLDAGDQRDPQGELLGSSDICLNATYRFDSYVVGPCNRFAHAASVGVAENPGQIYNPLFLHGSVGLGKTHLLQSLCRTILDRTPASRILYLSCETFVNHFIGALEHGDLAKFRNKYRNVDLLVVDDIHLLANKERTQEEFFHTFNTLYNAGKQIVLSSDSPPVDIPTLQERLVSRFKWGLVTEIEPPCYETRMAILKRKSRERGRELPDEVASFLAERIDTNIRELEGAVTKVMGYAALSGQNVTLQLVRQCLRELFSTRSAQPSIEDIMNVVTERFGVKLAELQSRRRTNAVAYPRQIGMYLARRITQMSLAEIGGYFGGRDHTTVLHAVRKITRMSKEDPGCTALLTELSFELQGPPQI